MVFLSALFACTGMKAQQGDALTAFAASMESSRAEFSYGFTVDDGRVKMQGDGNVTVQGSSYHMTGNGLEMWCDGLSRWTADAAAKEVVIESFDGTMTVMANPALLVGNLGREFSWEGNGVSGTFNGKPARMFVLKGKENAEIKELIVYMDRETASISGAEITLPDGSMMTLAILSFRFSEQGPLSDFIPDGFPSGWIVTDLR